MPNQEIPTSISLLPLLRLVRSKFIAILIFGFVGLLAGFLISKTITPLFQSFVVLYPSNSNSRDKQLEEFSFGMEIHSERLMQLLASNILIDSLDRRFDLVGHYDIDKSKENWYDEFMEMIKDRIDYHKTRYVSVVVSVKDQDPEMAAAIANASAELVNKINANIVKEGAQKSLEAVRVEFDRRKNESLGMNDSILGLRNNVTGIAASKLKSEIGMHENRISTLRKQLDEIRQQHGIFDFGYQINVLNEQLAEAQSNFLQEEGKLRVIERAEGLDDSIVVMIRANFNGAQQRKMYFEQQLASLLKVNQRYSAISGELESELELQRNTRSELQQIDFSVEPDLKTNRIKAMEQDFEFDQLQLRSLREQYQTALSNLLDPVPMAYVISPARPSYRKIYPYTIVNTLIGGISSALFGLFLLAYLEKRRSKA